MNWLTNPIWITQGRIARRRGLLPTLLFSLLVGLCLLVGYLSKIHGVDAAPTRREMAAGFYLCLMVLQGFLWIVAVFSRISRTMVDERRSGLLESNRLTPLPVARLAWGYLLGSPLSEGMAGVVLAPIGLLIIFISGLPVWLWFSTQLLLIATALLFGLLGLLAGLAAKRGGSGVILLLLLLVFFPFSFGGEGLLLANFFLPIFAVGNQFPHELRAIPFDGSARLFGGEISILALTLFVQAVCAAFVWRAVLRKFRDPSGTAFSVLHAVQFFAFLVVMQSGLLWHEWRGNAGATWDHRHEIVMLHAGIMMLGMLMLTPFCVSLGSVRMRSLGGTQPMGSFWQSGPFAALAFAAIGAMSLFSHFFKQPGADFRMFFVPAANLFLVFLLFAFVVELAMLRSRKSPQGFAALGLFVLFALPLLLAAVLDWGQLASASPLVVGCWVLGSKIDHQEIVSVRWSLVLQAILVLVFGVYWFVRRRNNAAIPLCAKGA